jgi:hypothetical protein
MLWECYYVQPFMAQSGAITRHIDSKIGAYDVWVAHLAHYGRLLPEQVQPLRLHGQRVVRGLAAPVAHDLNGHLGMAPHG